MRQVLDYCGNSGGSAFGRWLETFLFLIIRRFQKLIADLLRAHGMGALRYGYNNSDCLEDGKGNV